MKLEEKLNLLNTNGTVPCAAIYVRGASDKQREEQLKLTRDFAQAHNINIVREYVDNGSGASDSREAFHQMIKDSASGEFHFVLVHQQHCFSRNRVDAITYESKLMKNSVTLISVLDRSANETTENALLEGILKSVAEFYSRNLAREVMKS